MSAERLRADCRAAYLLRLLADLESGTPRQTWFLALARAADLRLLAVLERVPGPLWLDRVIGRLLGWLSPAGRGWLMHCLEVPGRIVYQLAAHEPFPPPIAAVWPPTGQAMLAMVHEALIISLSLVAGAAALQQGAGLVLLAGMLCVAVGAVYIGLRSLFRSAGALARQNLLLRDEPLHWSAEQEEAAGDLPEWLAICGINTEQVPQVAAGLLADPEWYADRALCHRLRLIPVPLVRPSLRALVLSLSFAGAAWLPVWGFALLAESVRLPVTLAGGWIFLAGIDAWLAKLAGNRVRSALLRSLSMSAAMLGCALSAGWLAGMAMAG